MALPRSFYEKSYVYETGKTGRGNINDPNKKKRKQILKNMEEVDWWTGHELMRDFSPMTYDPRLMSLSMRPSLTRMTTGCAQRA